MIKAIIFDIGDVIVDENNIIFFKEIAKKYNLNEIDQKKLIDTFKHNLGEYDCGTLSEEELGRKLSKKLGKKIDTNLFFGLRINKMEFRNEKIYAYEKFSNTFIIEQTSKL